MSTRVTVITGANRGLGLATARELSRRGHRVILTSRKLAQAEAAAADLGGEVTPAELDVSSSASVADFFATLSRLTQRVDVLINNAGAMFGGYEQSALEVAAEDILTAIDTNALGAFRMTQRVLPMMNAQGYGRVVNVSSGMGALTDMDGGAVPYRMSKTALNATTRIFHAEAGTNVKINSVCPGWVRTDMGGTRAPRSIEQGIAGIVWAATLPDDGPSGGFFRDGEPIPW